MLWRCGRLVCGGRPESRSWGLSAYARPQNVDRGRFVANGLSARGEAFERACIETLTGLPEATTVHEKYGMFGGRRTLGLEPFAWNIHSITGDDHVLDRDAWCFSRNLSDLFV